MRATAAGLEADVRKRTSIALVAALICALPRPAMAYIGPGAGLSAVGALIAVVAGIALALVGFVWYPIKRLLRRKRPAEQNEDGAAE